MSLYRGAFDIRVPLLYWCLYYTGVFPIRVPFSTVPLGGAFQHCAFLEVPFDRHFLLVST